MKLDFSDSVKPTPQQNMYFVVASGHVLVKQTSRAEGCLLSEADFNSLGMATTASLPIGHLGDSLVTAIEVAATKDDLPSVAGKWVSSRSLLFTADENMFVLISRALQMLKWQQSHKFCGVCGSKTELRDFNRSWVCTSCETPYYPKISPCVIGLVHHGDKCILIRSVTTPPDLYTTIAGFMEPGESAEHAFHREVKEEVNVEIKNLRYLGSQSWPFPGQLMIGFHAEYAGGEIKCQPGEIDEANWYHYKDLPQYPPEQTISGQIIRRFINEREGI